MKGEANSVGKVHTVRFGGVCNFSPCSLIKLESRNARVSGFRDQDVLALQKILDDEFETEKESLIKQQREKTELAAKQAGLRKKRLLLEKQLKEELLEIERDQRIEFWLKLVSCERHP